MTKDPSGFDRPASSYGSDKANPEAGPPLPKPALRAAVPYKSRLHRRQRRRRHRRRAYIRSMHFLPSLATLGNAVCGFGAMYVATLHYAPDAASPDSLTNWFARHHFFVAAYLVFVAMLFDALDGRLARWTRHTTDFGGQLDSLADVISFGAAPAFLALQVFKSFEPTVFPVVSRLVWAIGALYMSCAAIRLARFNVSNEHGEQHHFSFLGLPSPGAGGAVAAFVLMQLDLAQTASGYPLDSWQHGLFSVLASIATWMLPALVLGVGLLMVSNIRYPHLVNRYLRGRRSLARLVAVLMLVLLLVVAHRYTLGIGSVAYALSGFVMWTWLRLRRRRPPRGGEAAGVTAPLQPVQPAGSAHASP